MELTSGELRKAIETLYEVFKHYSVSPNFGQCSSLTKHESNYLSSVQISNLSAEDLEDYAFSVEECGTENDLKHFLPRLLELFASRSFSLALFDLLLQHITYYGKWLTWSEKEKLAINSYLEELWKASLNSFPPIIFPLEFLIGISPSGVTPFLKLWETDQSIPALQNLTALIELFFYSTDDLSREAESSQIKNWLLQPKIAYMLEEATFKYLDQPVSDDFAAAVDKLNWLIKLEQKP